MNTGLAIVGRCEDLHKPVLVRRLDLFVVGPPLVGVFQEYGQRILIVFLFELLLSGDLVFRNQLTFH